MIWIELTFECQLACVHCYAGSGPGLGHGTMNAGAWEDVMSQAAALGVRHVVVIGGEPTLHPDLTRLVRASLALGLTVEVYSNLVRVTPGMWELFSMPGVSLATSWYTADRGQHAVITGGRDTWRQTRANIAEAVRRGIPLRAGVIGGIVAGQRAQEAERELRALGVDGIGRDELRQFGRGTITDSSQACGHCGQGIAAILPDGSVTPCPLTRWLRAGNVRDAPLGTILGEPLAAVTSTLKRGACSPECSPNAPCTPQCNPNASCNPSCGPRSQCTPKCAPDSYCQPVCSPGACTPRVK
jgi:MoaA/NifB/PqqE/SkfB family radical SAM enzyme